MLYRLLVFTFAVVFTDLADSQNGKRVNTHEKYG